MSRVTRNSKTSVFSDVGDENAQLQQRKSLGMRRSLGGGGPVQPVQPQQPSNPSKPHGMNTRKTARTALGDISNKIKSSDQQAGQIKKQRLVAGSQPMVAGNTAFPAANGSLLPAIGVNAPSMPEVELDCEVEDDMMGGDNSAAAVTNPVPVGSNPRRSSLAAMVDEVDVAGPDEDTTLEDSVGGLTIHALDAADAGDPNQVSEYVMDIVNYFKRIEARRMPSPNYMAKQTDINAKMREILIDWLVEVHQKFKLRPETLYLTVNVIDRFLERRAVSRTKLQLVGCTAMLISSKYEEIYAPEVRDFVYISDKAYTREQILAMESIMLNTLNFNLTVPSTLRFGQRWAKVAGADETTRNLINFLMELTLQESKFLRYLPSYTAAAATYLALRMTGNTPWTPALQAHTRYSENDIKACVMDLHALASKENSKYKAVRKKFLSRKFLEVAKIPCGPPPFPVVV